MNIGDKVRSIRGNEEGIITSFPNPQEVEVEIEDGFRIPFLRNNLVLVNNEERSYFRKEEEAPARKKKSKQILRKQEAQPAQAQRGVYLAFVHYNDQLVDVCLANNTDLSVAYTLGEAHERLFYGVKMGMLEARSWVQLQQLELSKFESWPAYVVQLLFFHKGVYNYQTPLEKKFRFKADTFYKSKRDAPIIGRKGYVFQVDGENLTPINPQQLRTQIMEGKPANNAKKNIEAIAPKKHRSGNMEVDLHIEKLTPHHNAIPQEEILKMQLEAFERAFDQAIAQGYDDLIVIHGVGNGTLRLEVQRRLSGHPHVDYFKDARRERFGYGATQIKIK